MKQLEEALDTVTSANEILLPTSKEKEKKMANANSSSANLAQIKKFFGMTMQEMKTEWSALDDKSKQQLAEGIGNETYDYEV